VVSGVKLNIFVFFDNLKPAKAASGTPTLRSEKQG
jgi:hypothetical protein